MFMWSSLQNIILRTMNKKIKLIFICIVIFFLVSGCDKKERENIPVQQKTYFFSPGANKLVSSGDSLLHYVKIQMAFGPRVPGTEAHSQTKNWILSKLKNLADTVFTQDFVFDGYDNQKLPLSNIIAQFNPSATNRIFFSAHWDSRPRADQEKNEKDKNLPVPGANDGASGVAVLLELARILAANRPEYGIDLIFFDGEDYGYSHDLMMFCIGSKYFAVTNKSYRPLFGVLVDMVGDKEAKFLKEENSMKYAEEFTNIIWQIASEMNVSRFVNLQGEAIYDDHIPLNQNGIKTVNIIDSELIGADPSLKRRAYWHTLNDTIENIGSETLSDVTNVLLELIYTLKFR